MTIQEAYKQSLYQLFELYNDREAATICDLLIENVTGQTKLDRILYKDIPVSTEQLALLENYIQQLLTHKPIQYVLKETWFAGMKLFVNENVLIPRPETEELVQYVLDFYNQQSIEFGNTILDIGTGSGCIPIAIKKKLINATIDAIDISESALEVATQNALSQQANINFLALDILDETLWQQLPSYSIIISNPPYIQQKEVVEMEKNVINFEPHLALFVPNNNALLFYNKIATFGLQHLEKNGVIFVEMNEALSYETKALFENFGYTTQMFKDLQEKDRILKAWFA